MRAAMSTFISALGLTVSPIALRRRPHGIPTPDRWFRRAFRSTALSGAPRGQPFVSGDFPRAAVSTVVQCRIEKSSKTSPTNLPFEKYQYFYLLVKRGKEPNMGMWSLPGGKLEWGETTLAGAQRELHEETTWPTTNDSANIKASLQWYNGTISATESIGDGYHYLIAQCFAQLTIPAATGDAADAPPILGAADDAAAVEWFTRDELKEGMRDVKTTPGVLGVIDRAEELSRMGLLPVN
jgi:8-oxo-dGTP diphosphatase